MRLDFNVLWIDDQPGHVKSFQETLQRKLGELGFELKVNQIAKLDGTTIGRTVEEDLIDLVLVDYDLGSGNGGEIALAEIRHALPYKEIIFYTAADVEKLREIAYAGKLDGLHFSTRFNLADDAYSLIDEMLRKVMDIDHMRGVVMAATSDIDFLIEESLLAAYARLEGDAAKGFVAGVITDIRSKVERWVKELEKAEKKGGFDEILKLKHLCSSTDRLRILLEQLTGWDARESSHLAKARVYGEDVVPRRNKLAHVRLRLVDGKAVLEGPAGAVSNDEMKQLRRDLIDHRINFTDIGVLMDVPMG